MSVTESTNLELLLLNGLIGLLPFIGFILFLVAMYGFSKDYSEPRIFRYIIYAFIGALVTAIVIMTIWAILTFVNILNQATLSSLTSSTDVESLLAPYLSPIIPVMSVVALIWIYFNYKSYNLLAAKSEVPLFRNAAKIFVIGAIVNVAGASVFAVLAYTGIINITFMELVSLPGGLIQYVAWAYMAKGVSAIKVPLKQTVAPQTFPFGMATQFCSNCGAPTQPNDVFCVRCGKKFQ
ncbi:MAG TPA: DUF996 domain-containing protein [Candidatus Acidoferrales bacterium]|nr:DUF996 domain-containing protein [Candidatus Acidoferrales bacterium]